MIARSIALGAPPVADGKTDEELTTPSRPLDYVLVLLSILKVGVPAILVAFVLAEGVLRLAGFPREGERSFRPAFDFEKAHPGQFKAGGSVPVFWPPEIAFTANFDDYGCRGPTWPGAREARPPALLCVGDSVTFGYGVADAETWPIALERRLAAAGAPRDVVNLSCGGWKIEDQLEHLDAALEALAPSVVVLLAPAEAYTQPEIGHPETPIQRSFRRAKRKHTDATKRFFDGLAVRDAKERVKLWRLRSKDEGAGEFPPEFTDPFKPEDEMGPYRARYEERLVELRTKVEAAGARLLVATFPRLRSEPEDHGVRIEVPWTRSLLARLGWPTVDVFDAMAAAEPEDPTPLFLWPYDLHPSARGQDLIAAAIEARLVSDGWLDAEAGGD